MLLELRFPDDKLKRFEIIINGKKIGFNTYQISESRKIDEYVLPGTNSIEIKPLQDITITELKVRTR